MEKKILKIIEDQNILLKKLLDVSEEKTAKKNSVKKKNEKFSRKNEDDSQKLNLKSIPIRKNTKNIIKKIIKFNVINESIYNNLKSEPILICSTQYPGYGGGATNSYNIFKFLKSIGFERVVCAFFVHEKFINQPNFNYNPDNLDNVVCFSRKNMNESEIIKKINMSINLGENENFAMALCKNIWAAEFVPKIYPNVPLIYLVSGNAHITQRVNENPDLCYTKLVSDEKIWKELISTKNENEISAMKKSKYILCNSENSLFATNAIYGNIYGHKIKKLYTTYFTNFVNMINFNFEYENFSDRPIDLIYIASNFDRNIKGKHMAQKIFNNLESSYKGKKINIVVIGDNVSSMNFNDTKSVKYITMEKINNSDVLKYLYNTKVLIIPSLYEACPNTMHEGIIAGAQVLVSENVGSFEILDPKNVVKDYNNASEWSEKIINSLSLENNNPNLNYLHIVVSDFMKLFSDVVVDNFIEECKPLEHANYIHLDYDMIKMYGEEIFENAVSRDYKIILPNIIKNMFGISVDDKYNNQINKMARYLYPRIIKNKENICGFCLKDYTDFIKFDDDTIIFTNNNIDKIKNKFINLPVVNSITKLTLHNQKKLVIILSLPNKGIPDIFKFIDDVGKSYTSVSILSSLNKCI